MSELRNTNSNHVTTSTSIDKKQTKIPLVSDYKDTVFQRLDAQDVEQFYKSYRFWSLQRRIETLYTEIGALQQALTDNAILMQQVQPSTIALASLAQLQASGVRDLDLLDRMLERGETWLDHTVQLLEQCEKLDVIQGDYTEWCEHALDGAYDWIESMDATEALTIPPITNDKQQTDLQTVTEEQLLQKLMSDEEGTEKIAALGNTSDPSDQNISEYPPVSRKITQPLDLLETTVKHEAIESPSPSRKITQPLDLLETTIKHEAIESPSLLRKITRPLDPHTASNEAVTPTSEESTLPQIADSTPPEETLRDDIEPSSGVHPFEETEAVQETNQPQDNTPIEFPRSDTDPVEPFIPETPFPEDSENAEDTTSQTEKMPALVLKHSHTIGTATTSKDRDIQEMDVPLENVAMNEEKKETIENSVAAPSIEDAEIVQETGNTQDDTSRPLPPAEAKPITAQAIAISKSAQSHLQQTQQSGFWHFLLRLLSAIFRWRK